LDSPFRISRSWTVRFGKRYRGLLWCLPADTAHLSGQGTWVDRPRLRRVSSRSAEGKGCSGRKTFIGRPGRDSGEPLRGKGIANGSGVPRPTCPVSRDVGRGPAGHPSAGFRRDRSRGKGTPDGKRESRGEHGARPTLGIARVSPVFTERHASSLGTRDVGRWAPRPPGFVEIGRGKGGLPAEYEFSSYLKRVVFAPAVYPRLISVPRPPVAHSSGLPGPISTVFALRVPGPSGHASAKSGRDRSSGKERAASRSERKRRTGL